MNVTGQGQCPYCNMWHTGTCPRIRLIEYNESGQVVRIEFFPASPALPSADGGSYTAPIWSSGS